MSHIVDQQCTIKNLDALAAACARLGLDLRRDQKTHAWWGRFVGDSPGIEGRDPATYGTCDHAIGEIGKISQDGYNGNWEIGLCRRQDGSGYTLVYDNYGDAGRRLEQLAGKGLKKLIEEYGIEVATRRLRKQGYRVTRTTDAKGRAKLVCFG